MEDERVIHPPGLFVDVERGGSLDPIRGRGERCVGIFEACDGRESELDVGLLRDLRVRRQSRPFKLEVPSLPSLPFQSSVPYEKKGEKVGETHSTISSELSQDSLESMSSMQLCQTQSLLRLRHTLRQIVLHNPWDGREVEQLEGEGSDDGVRRRVPLKGKVDAIRLEPTLARFRLEDAVDHGECPICCSVLEDRLGEGSPFDDLLLRRGEDGTKSGGTLGR